MWGSNITTNGTANTTDGSTERPEVYYIILAILGSLGVLFNGVLLFVFWKNKTPEFRVGTCYVIGNLAFADCLTGIAVLLYACRYPPINNVQLPFIWTTIEASLMSLMFLSVERIVAFQYPFASKSIVTVKRTIIAIIFIWIFAITCGVFIYHYTIVTQLVMSVIFEVCVVIFLICQGYIILTMQKRKKAHLFCDRDVSIVTRKHIQRQRHSNNVTTVVLILIAVVVITLLPYMVAIQIYFLSELKLRPPLDKDTKKVVLDFIAYFYPIELLNFIVNPIIYAYRLKRYRKALLFAFSFLNCGPFVKERTRTFSDSKSADDFDKERRHSKRMTKLIAV